jgi:hypothetical protein
MKKTMHKLITLAVALLAATQTALAVTGVQLSFQGSDVVLTWPSQPGQTFIVGYRPAFDPATPWTFLTNALPAAAGNQTTFTHSGAFQGGGGQQMAAAFGGDSPQPQRIALLPDERAARIAAARESAKRALAHLMAQLEAAIAKAKAMRDERAALVRAGIQPPAAAVAAEAIGPAGVGPASPMTSSSAGFYFVAEYGEDSDGDAVDNQCELYIGHNILKQDTDGDGINDGLEDTDTDGDNDFTECLVGTDPLVPDGGTWQPPTSGGVYSGEIVLNLNVPVNLADSVGPMLDANGFTADGMVATAPSPTSLRLQWNSTFIDRSGALAFQPAGPIPTLTPEEGVILRDAFGHGTSIPEGGTAIVSSPDQAKVDLIARETLEKYEQVSMNQLRKDFKWVQDVNSGAIQVPPQDLQRLMNARLASIHTQFTRLRSLTSSLARRFGRAVNRVVPFLGGILILANAEEVAANFLSAMQDYAHDIANGDDETGSAAILAGECNNLAPGSGNIVLNYLLR